MSAPLRPLPPTPVVVHLCGVDAIWSGHVTWYRIAVMIGCGVGRQLLLELEEEERRCMASEELRTRR